MPFQSAAGSVTALMKDCQESQKRMTELAVQLGVQRRNKEMLGWLRSKKRGTIRRDELVAFICGKNRFVNRPSSTNWSSRHRLPDPSNGSNNSGSQSNSLRSPTHHNLTFNRLSLADPAPSIVNENNDLQTFREALALSGNCSHIELLNSNTHFVQSFETHLKPRPQLMEGPDGPVRRQVPLNFV